MSFATDNNNENAIKDSERAKETKSPGRLLAEERAERIRYAQEYRRKLEAEQNALPTKKTKAAEQKEKEKTENAEREKAERLLLVQEANEEAARRISDAADKVKQLKDSIGAMEARMPKAPDTVAIEQTAEPTENASGSAPIIVHISAHSAKIPATVAMAASPVSEVKAVPSGIATINVTEKFKRDTDSKPIVSYGRVVTEGGWEHEIDDVIRPVPVKESVYRESAACAAEPEGAPVPVPVPIAVPAAAVSSRMAPDSSLEESILEGAEADIKNAEQNIEAAPVTDNRAVGAADSNPSVKPADKASADNAKAEENSLYIEDSAPKAQSEEPDYVRYIPLKGDRDVLAAEAGLMDPSGVDGVDFDEQFNQFQIEDAHIRYLAQTKKLDKMRSKASSGRRYNIGAREDCLDKSTIKTLSKKSADLIKLRMEYDVRVSANDLKMDLLQFSDDVKFDKTENKIATSKILKIKKSIKKAKKLEKKATKRYYTVIAKEAERPTILRNVKKQEKLVSIISTLESLIREREAIDAKLITFYKESGAKAGGSVRIRAEKKRYKKARKIRKSLKSVYRRIESYDIPDSLRSKLLHLLNTKIVSESTITYNKYMLRRLKPKNEAKRALKRNIKRAKYSLKSVDSNISRLLRKARRYARVRRRRTFLFVILLILVLGAACFFLFGNQIMSLFGLA